MYLRHRVVVVDWQFERLVTNCVVSYIVIGRRQRRGLSPGTRFWIQGSVPAAECSTDSGHPWAPVAWRSTRCPVSAGPWCSAYSPWCGHQGTAGTEPVSLIWFICIYGERTLGVHLLTVTCNQGFVASFRWQTVYVWCPWISQRPCPLTHTCGRLQSVTTNMLLGTHRKASQINFTKILVSFMHLISNGRKHWIMIIFNC